MADKPVTLDNLKESMESSAKNANEAPIEESSEDVQANDAQKDKPSEDGQANDAPTR